MPLRSESTYVEVERERAALEKRVEERIGERGADPAYRKEEKTKKVEEIYELQRGLALVKFQQGWMGTPLSLILLKPTQFGDEKMAYAHTPPNEVSIKRHKEDIFKALRKTVGKGKKFVSGR